jgi:pimeloyl-ACP methyl ester carboxylesterase
MGATEEEIDAMRSNPYWTVRLDTVPTMPRELRAEDDWIYRPGRFDAAKVPALLLAGSESPLEQDEATRLAAAALPDARVHVLEGQGHFAIASDPAMVAAVIRDFMTA